ncbi:hypothetical protein BJV82DRAFT_14664 [Fennellomyces sp. T-0311]|nr:hypothetical protein BJV82DRAFT_14664 [Fennellomyces sp. T-0311]
MIFKSETPEVFHTPQTVFEHVFETKGISPNMPMYVDADDPDQYVSHGQLKQSIQKLAAGLKREFKIQKGDVVAMLAPNVWEFVMVLHGTAVAGGTFSAIDFSTQDPECIARDMALVDTKYLVVHPMTLSLGLKAAQIIGLPKSSILTLGQPVGSVRSLSQVLLNHTELASPLPITKDEFEKHPVYLYFTSGTTGTPKAVIMTHKMMITATSFVRHPVLNNPALQGLVKSSTHAFLAAGSLYHVSSLLFTMHVCIKLGLRTYLMKMYNFENLCKYIQKYRITDVPFSPWGMAELARSPIAEKYDLSSLTVIVSTGAGLDVSIAKTVLQRFKIPLLNAYGMTEMWGICHPDPRGGLEQIGLPGKLCCGTEAKIIDENGKELGVGEPGEMLVRGPGLTPGYYNDPEATARMTDEEGFFHTGDLCIIDKNGVITVIERLKDTIKYRNNWISPKEIESVLMTVPSIVDCAVVGVNTKYDAMELPTAFVILVDGVQQPQDMESKLLDYAHSRLHDTVRIAGGIKIMKQFPRTAAGKIQKRVLRQLAEKEFEKRYMEQQKVQDSAAVVDKLQVA